MFREYYSISDVEGSRLIFMQDDQSGKMGVLKNVTPEMIPIFKEINRKSSCLPEIYEFGTDYIITEYIDGCALDDEVAMGSFAKEEIPKLISDLCQALKVFHSVHLCHMDVTPKNIVKSKHYYVLIDFNTALPFGVKPEKGNYGNALFCSPEHFEFDTVDAATDVYSVGKVLEYLLQSVSDDTCFRELIQKATAVSKKDRIKDVDSFYRMFQEICRRHTDCLPDGDAAKSGIDCCSTADLLASMNTYADLLEFFSEHKADFIYVGIARYFDRIIEQKHLKKSDIIRKSGIERTYGYQLLNGTKKPSRDKMIQLCMGAELSFDETQIALKQTGFMELYPRVKRDCILIYAIKSHKTVMETDELLLQFKEPELNRL
ncbi:MAG: protein kinase [Clostridia bacterium]|nr:protein kinase [Clostridia bacterium]